MKRREFFLSTIGLAAGFTVAKLPTASVDSGELTVNKEHPFFAKVSLKDIWGNTIPMAYSWDAKNEIAGVFITTNKRGTQGRVAVTKRKGAQVGEVARATAHMPGCKLYWKDTDTLVSMEEIKTQRRLSSKKGEKNG